MDVSIVSPEEEVWHGDGDMVIARSPEGEFAIMNGHIPFLAALVPWRVTVVSGGSRETFFVPGGFLEASRSGDAYHVIVLADDAEPISDDIAEVQKRAADVRASEEDDG
ncbi:MAG: F-type H+-transporting ATPase subunit epsilon [Actinomycetota bacterium]|jgi:F-type H+-transporting ATPase subunit epsilon|nr:F-type H+-transporting ATPase subunit epsilon [Actinomycetota bacterium]